MIYGLEKEKLINNNSPQNENEINFNIFSSS